MDLRGTLALLLVLGIQVTPPPAPASPRVATAPRALSAHPPWDDQPVVSLFDGGSLDLWEFPKGRRDRFRVVGDVLRVRGRSGRLVTRRGFDDFVLTFEARQADADSVGGVLVRMLPPPPATPASRRRLAFEVPVAAGKKPSVPLLVHVDDQAEPAVESWETLIQPDTEWHRYRVECIADRVRVRRDDTDVADVAGIYLNTGPVGLYAARGQVEFRALTLRVLNQPPEPPSETADALPARLSEGGVVSPRVLREVKPQYTPNALRAGIQGEVWLDCVVAASGRVEQCSVVRRVSTELDAQALAAARQWTFTPGTRDGTPVAVLVTIAVGFTLK